MKLKLKITHLTTNSELIHLGNFFSALGMDRGAKVFAAPTDPAELDEGEITTFIHPSQAHNLRTGEIVTIDTGVSVTEPPKKRRRTKDEMRVDAIVAENAKAAAAAEAEGAIAPGEPGNEQPASTPTVDTTEAATTAPATASPSDPAKEYSEIEVQDLAGKVARTVGPEVVKGKIAELGVARIAELTQDLRNKLGAFLVSQLP